MSPFGINILGGGPLVPTPQAPRPLSLEEQRRLVVRARRQARQWFIRAVLLLVFGAIAVRWGWLAFGLVLFALSLLGIGLASSISRRAAELETRLPPREAGP